MRNNIRILGIKLIFLLIIMIYSLSCSRKINNLEGSWAITEILYKEKDISQMNYNHPAVMTNSLTIQNKFFFFKFENEPKRLVWAKIRYIQNNGTKIIQLYNATDSIFNGFYNVNIIQENNNRYIKSYNLELRSDDLYILGNKYVSYL